MNAIKQVAAVKDEFFLREELIGMVNNVQIYENSIITDVDSTNRFVVKPKLQPKETILVFIRW